ncbi:MAG TPA: septal ring lytic transglycosylase RlpA family protein [Candidatus Binataceae bacterium]|jgi:rare lipoprotein A|nr:septal ring lytic transglycosylase RlpA family protein [Candidatus Binataceae bacterium]
MRRYLGQCSARLAWTAGAALWLGGCSAYSARRAAPAPAPLPAAAPSSGHVTTVASWYGPGFQGRRTSSGEVFDRNQLTAASRTLPLGTRVRVTNLGTGQSVVVRINDRGPYVRGRGIDLSQRAAQRIGLARRGVARVQIDRLDTTASADAAAPARWSGQVNVRRYRMRRRYHRPIHHYAYASAAGAPPSRRMVANPVGDWLLEMVR